MQVEIWSDVACPWCYIGKRRFETALGRFTHADEVEVVWRSYQLDPDAPTVTTGSMAEHLARKYGISVEEALRRMAHVAQLAAAEGLEYHLDRVDRQNTFDAHRMVHLAARHGRQGEMKERLMRAYFTDVVAVADHTVLSQLAAEVGLDADETARVLSGDEFADEVRSDERRAAEHGAHGVPYFLVDGKYAVSGAQDPARFLQLLDRAWLDAKRPNPVERP